MTSPFTTLRAAIALAAVSLVAPLAQAASEDLLSDNSTFGTAQFVGPFSSEGFINVFGLRGTVSLFGSPILDNSNADYYSFDVVANQKVTLSVTTPEGPFFNNDPVVGLYSPGGLQLINDDDGGPGFDSLLSLVISAPGRYVAAVGGYSDFNFIGGGDTDFFYTLQIQSESAPVPVPAAAWLLGSGLAGMLGFRRRAS